MTIMRLFFVVLILITSASSSIAQNFSLTGRILDAETSEFSAVLCGRDAVQIAPAAPNALDLQSLADRLAPLGEVKVNEYLLRFSSECNELTVFRDGRAIIKGTDDIPTARSLYARYIGT